MDIAHSSLQRETKIHVYIKADYMTEHVRDKEHIFESLSSHTAEKERKLT